MNNATPETDQQEEYPLVSAIMLVGRVAVPDILAGIRCFQAQSYPYKELIIVNNAKTQFAASELNIKAERDIFIIDTPYELTAGMARNFGIRAANGQILAQFDADFYHHPQRLESQIASIAENTAHICVLSETLYYSHVSGRASLHSNDKQAILNTMVFTRPLQIDYPDSLKYEEFGILDKMIKKDMRPVAISKPELCCKFRFTKSERIQKPINHGLTKKQFQTVKKIVKDHYSPSYNPKSSPNNQKTSDSENQEPQSVNT